MNSSAQQALDRSAVAAAIVRACCEAILAAGLATALIVGLSLVQP